MVLKYKRITTKFDLKSALKTDNIRLKKEQSYILKLISFLHLTFFIKPRDYVDFWNIIYFDYYYDNHFGISDRYLSGIKYLFSLYFSNLNYLEHTFSLTNIEYILDPMFSGFINKQLELTKIFYHWKDFFFFYNSYGNIESLFVYNYFRLFDFIDVTYQLQNSYLRHTSKSMNFFLFITFLLNVNFFFISFIFLNIRYLFGLMMRSSFLLFPFLNFKSIKYKYNLLFTLLKSVYLYIFILFYRKVFNFSLFFFIIEFFKIIFKKFSYFLFIMFIFIARFIAGFSLYYIFIRNITTGVINLFELFFLKLKNFMFFNFSIYFLELYKDMKYLSRAFFNICLFDFNKELLNAKSFIDFWSLYYENYTIEGKIFWWLSYNNQIKNLFNFKLTTHKSLHKYFDALELYKISNIVLYDPVLFIRFNKPNKYFIKTNSFNLYYLFLFILVIFNFVFLFVYN